MQVLENTTQILTELRTSDDSPNWLLECVVHVAIASSGIAVNPSDKIRP